MRTRPILAALLSLAGLTGCDPTYTVSRSAKVAGMPRPAEVLAAVRSAPGVEGAVDDDLAGPPRRRPRGAAATRVAVEYHGRGKVYAVVEFVREGRQVYYRNGFAGMFHPPQDEVDAIYPVILAVEQRLDALPGLAGLRQAAVQECDGVRCPPPPGG